MPELALRGKAAGVRWFIQLLLLVGILAGCSGTTREVETGYKGEARVNPWLAASRFLEHYEYQVDLISTWRTPAHHDAVWLVPANVINNELYARQLVEWVEDGGHLICLIDQAHLHNDWSGRSSDEKLEPAFEKLLAAQQFTILPNPGRSGRHSSAGTPVTRRLRFSGGTFQTEMDPARLVAYRTGIPDALASARVGNGRFTVLTDAGPLRNRYIDNAQHAALLLALVDSSNGGRIVIVRGAALSLWALLMERAWAAMIGLVVVILFWLWKNLGRFGPLEAAEAPSRLRGYDHHLEALGDFQWRLDKGASMIAPLRQEILERTHRLMTKTGRLDDDIFQLLAERVGITRERAFRALAEPAPADAGIFTRTAADLQAILKSLP